MITPTLIEECKKKFNVDETHFCAVGDGQNTCNGDSGGPLMYQFAARGMILVGVISYGGIDCTDMELPGVFTRVRYYERWLKDNMHM